MQNVVNLICCLLILNAFTACNQDKDVDKTTVCDDFVLVDSKAYAEHPDDHLTIQSAAITGDCLNITFAASGCSGKTWVVKLIDSGTVFYSDPPQRNLRLSLKNSEMCEAYIGKTVSVDIKELKSGGDKVLLNLTNSGMQVLYEYQYH
jgi:hypothetical protein